MSAARARACETCGYCEVVADQIGGGQAVHTLRCKLYAREALARACKHYYPATGARSAAGNAANLPGPEAGSAPTEKSRKAERRARLSRL